MKREIKFRAWDSDNCVMYYQDEDSGLCAFAFDKDGLCCWVYPGDTMPGEDPNDRENTPVREAMQYTGLKDKNGREIYGGDIVSHIYIGSERSMSIVEWRMAGWFANSQDDPTQRVVGYGDLADCRDIEVIGNIYENPELITK